MEEKVNKIDWKELSKDFFKTILSYHFVKRALLLFALLFLILPLSQFLLCVNPILIPSDGKMFWVFYIIINGLIGLAIFLLFKNKYRFGYWEYLFGIVTIFLYFTLRCFHLFNDSIIPEWSFTKAFGDYSYFDLPFFLISGTVFIRLIIGIFNYIKSFRENNHSNTFLEDNPVSTKQEIADSPYNHLISKIAPALFTDVYESSFSIGVIGPWGTGKSSFLKAVKKAVCDTSIKDVNKYYGTNLKKKPDTFFIEFSPFLNHNEEQVIHEFFTQLSNKLNERSGRLSNLITTYSEKLAKLSRHNSWFSLFNLTKSSRENLSAQELYTKIQEAIEDLNLKIIVTVDDLDRLNAKEILQVLKLIRNTSNFPNMVFLVAMDKEYVMRTLGEESKYAYRDYIEKFFQVEMVIKKPSYFAVVARVVKEAKQTKDINKSNLEKFEKVLIATSSKSLKIIFGNYRSAIKLMNQGIIDDKSIPNLFTEIDIKDYFMFTYLEMNFPKFYGKLTSEPKMFLYEDSEGKFRLKEKQKYNENKTSADVAKELTAARIGSIIEQFKSEKNFNFDDFDFGNELENPIDELKFTREEAEIIKNIFIEVFEEESKSKKSLRFTSKFFTLKRLKIDEKEISETDFDKIIVDSYNAKSKEEYDEIIKDANLTFKSNSLVKKLNDKDNRGVNIKEYLGLFSLLLVTYGKLYNEDENSINNILYNLIDSYFDIPGFNKNSEIDKEYLGVKNTIDKYWIQNDEVSNAMKLDFIFNIKENNYLTIREHFNKLWADDDYDEVCFKLFHQYLNEFKGKEWAVNDDTFLEFVGKLKENLKKNKYYEVQGLIKNHLKNSPIQNFCLQFLEGNYGTVKHKYQISDDVLLIFDSLFEFHEFIKEIINSSELAKPEMIKFLHVLKYYAISKEGGLRYGNPILEIFGDKVDDNSEEGFKEVSQIIIEIFNQGIFDELASLDISRDIIKNAHISAFVVDSIYFKNSKYLYIDIFVHNETVIKDFERYLNKLLNDYRVKEAFDLDKLSDGHIFSDQKEEKLLEVISVRTTNRK